MKRKILIVDDLALNRAMLSEILISDFDVLTAEDGKEAIKIIDEKSKDITAILLDLQMPKMDGFGVLDYLRIKKLLKHIPVIVITSDNSVENEKKCFDYGVADFIKKPFNDGIVKMRTKNCIDLFDYKNRLEEKVANQTVDLRRKNKVLEEQAEKLKKSNQVIIDVLGTVVESRNFESGQHILRVKDYTEVLARQVMTDYPEYGLTEHDIEVISSASALHDLGKIAISDSILLKPGKLTFEEFEAMKEHTLMGCDILNHIQGAWSEEYSKMSYCICRYHHERYDGKGYPDGLSGDDIPIAAQIVSITDVYDALINKRVYKEAYAKETAYNMIVSGECGTFSPKLLECLKKVKDRFESIADKE